MDWFIMCKLVGVVSNNRIVSLDQTIVMSKYSLTMMTVARITVRISRRIVNFFFHKLFVNIRVRL